MTWPGLALVLALLLRQAPGLLLMLVLALLLMLVIWLGLVTGLASQRRPSFSLRVSARNFGVLTKFLFHIRLGSFRSR